LERLHLGIIEQFAFFDPKYINSSFSILLILLSVLFHKVSQVASSLVAPFDDRPALHIHSLNKPGTLLQKWHRGGCADLGLGCDSAA